jgi:hypothetical protein
LIKTEDQHRPDHQHPPRPAQRQQRLPISSHGAGQ